MNLLAIIWVYKIGYFYRCVSHLLVDSQLLSQLRSFGSQALSCIRSQKQISKADSSPRYLRVLILTAAHSFFGVITKNTGYFGILRISTLDSIR